MKIKMNQILNFQNFAVNIKDIKMPIKTAYKLNKIIQKVEEEFSFYQKTFQTILNDFGKKDENGNYIFTDSGDSIEIKDGMHNECIQKVSELENLEIDFDNITFSIQELENLDLTLSDLECLMPFIAE